MSGFLPYSTGTAKILQPQWRRNTTSATASTQHRESTPEVIFLRPGTPVAPTGNTSVAQTSEIKNFPPRHAYWNSAVPCVECFNDDEDIQHHIDFDAVMLMMKVSTLSIVW
jgi:hypothetical protein